MRALLRVDTPIDNKDQFTIYINRVVESSMHVARFSGTITPVEAAMALIFATFNTIYNYTFDQISDKEFTDMVNTALATYASKAYKDPSFPTAVPEGTKESYVILDTQKGIVDKRKIILAEFVSLPEAVAWHAKLAGDPLKNAVDYPIMRIDANTQKG